MNPIIEKLGAKFQFFPDDPTDIFKRAGYRHVDGNSILSETLQILQQDFSLFLLKNFFSSIMHGYTMNVFESTPRS